MPKRIQRKRTKGWRKPEGAVYVGRRAKHDVGIWGNPWRPGRRMAEAGIGILYDSGLIDVVMANHDHKITTEEAVALYRTYIKGCIKNNPHYYTIERLRGKDLMCWCKLDSPCHADVLLEIANE